MFIEHKKNGNVLLTCQQELELQVVREVLEVFVRVCIFLDQPIFLSFVFNAISSRLDYVSTAFGSFALIFVFGIKPFRSTID